VASLRLRCHVHPDQDNAIRFHINGLLNQSRTGTAISAAIDEKNFPSTGGTGFTHIIGIDRTPASRKSCAIRTIFFPFTSLGPSTGPSHLFFSEAARAVFAFARLRNCIGFSLSCSVCNHRYRYKHQGQALTGESTHDTGW
jgi:hypothetical protein